MSSPSSTSSIDSRTLKKAPKAERGLKVDLRAAYHAGTGVSNFPTLTTLPVISLNAPSTVAQTTAGAITTTTTNNIITNTGTPMPTSPPPAPTSIKFADLPVPVRYTRVAPRPVTPYPPPMEFGMRGEYSDNAVEPSTAVLNSPRPKKVYQPLAL